MNRKMATTPELAPDTINAFPRKSFFISLLTRDIELSSCVLDLIDNSIDGIIKKSWVDVSTMISSSDAEVSRQGLQAYSIDVDLTEEKFSIKDNGSWITEEVLKNYAFRFGAGIWDNHKDDYNGLSVFWIWMKRAFFKLGRKIELKTKTQEASISVILDVDEWERDEDNWRINYSKEDNPGGETGTEIIITQLNEDVVSQVKSNEYMHKRMVTLLTNSYPLFISAGLTITMNNVVIENLLPKIIQESSYYAVREEKNFDDSGIDIKIVAGLINVDKTKTQDTWWFVFCNSRNVLYANKDYLTWWWMRWVRQFHTSINPFIGYVFFTSKDEKKLPRNTTKDGIVFDNIVYQKVLNKMIDIWNPIVKFLAKRYQKDSDFNRVLKWKKEADIITIIQKKEENQNFELTENSNTESIQYNVDKEKLDIVKDVLTNSLWKDSISNRHIWEYTFDYFYKNEID